MRTAFWDLECTHLKANFGVILCGGIKPLGEEAYVIFEGRKGSDDKELVTKIAEELEKYDVLVSYYGIPFDLKMLNSRLLYHGQPPLNRDIYHIDMYRVVRKIFNTHSRRLEAITQFLGIHGKTKLEPEAWMQAALDGDKKALKYIVEHCAADVEILEKLYDYPGVRQFQKTLTRV